MVNFLGRAFIVTAILLCELSCLGRSRYLPDEVWKYRASSLPKKMSSVRDPLLHEEVFLYPEVFRVNYEEMEKKFKFYMYEINCSGWTPYYDGFNARDPFYLNTIFRNSHLSTHNPERADLFFIPVPCPEPIHKVEPQELTLTKYVYDYPHWNRTLGADHFHLSCHGGIRATPTEQGQFLEKNSIRVSCSVSYNDSQYIPVKDVAVPHSFKGFYLKAGGTDLEERNKLAFWVGRPGTYLTGRPISMWINGTGVDRDALIDELGYYEEFYSSKYCICHGRDYVESDWIGYAIHYGCVPVILSDYHVLPFSDVLDWSKFSVILEEADIYRVKEVLEAIPFSKYKKLQANVVKVQRHLRWNLVPKEYDAFHMLMYKLWMRRHVIRYS